MSELKNKLHTNVSKISLKKLFKISSKIEKNEIINTKKNFIISWTRKNSKKRKV